MRGSEEFLVDATPNTLPSVQPLDAEPPPAVWLPQMPFLAGVFLIACVFIVVTIFCDQRQRKQFVPYDWNKSISTLTTPWYHFHGKPGDSEITCETSEEKHCLLTPMNFTAINMRSSKNKADSKYQKIKRHFPYFVTIPEEEEEEQEIRKFPSRSSYIPSTCI